jgi:hypothetical protein
MIPLNILRGTYLWSSHAEMSENEQLEQIGNGRRFNTVRLGKSPMCSRPCKYATSPTAP